MKAVLRKEETGNCVATSYPNGEFEITVRHGIEYDYLYDSEDNFYIIVNDIIYSETSTAFDFV